jgi:hypothetical protein
MPYKAATKPRPATTRAPARPATAAGASIAPAVILFLAVAVADDAVVVVVAVGVVLFGVCIFPVAPVAVAVTVAEAVIKHIPPVKTGLSLTTSASGGKCLIRADTAATGPAVRELSTEFPTLDTQLCACVGKVAAQLGIVPAAYRQKALLVAKQAARFKTPEGTREEMLGGGVGKF